MVYMEVVFNFIGYFTMLDKIKEIKWDIFRKLISFESALGHTANGAACAVFKNNLGLLKGMLFDTVKLVQIIKGDPVHQALSEVTFEECATAGQPVLRLDPQLLMTTASVTIIENKITFFIVLNCVSAKIIY